MSSMMLSMTIIACVLLFAKDPSLAWVFIAYALGGLGIGLFVLLFLNLIGTFESNLLSTIAPLGKNTKFWAIVAMPVSFIFN